MASFKSIAAVVATAAICVHACLQDSHEMLRRTERRLSRASTSPSLIKRATVTLPPVLTETERTLVDSFDNSSIAEWSYYYSSGMRLAGSNRSQAEWTRQMWQDAGLEVQIAEYWITYTEPSESSLRLRRPDGSSHVAQLREDVLEGDEQTANPDEKIAFHALSGSGNVSAEYIYVGRGTRGDYKRLVDLGVDLKGKIALAQYGGTNRGVKIKNAQENGMVGTVLYTDPLEDGQVTEANGYKAYPDGPARHPSAIQRGSTRWASLSFGDPSTIGYPSHRDAPRGDISDLGPKIPSIPISMRDGLQLLRALDGHGVSGKEANRSSWVGAFANLSYSSGPAPGATLDMVHFMERRLEPAWDVMGYINGTSEDEFVIIGNHRDGWTTGGAADAISGGSILVEMARAFGKLIDQGWKPRRTIIFGSWDAEEFGLMGSTEWVEDHLPELVGKAVAYINLDTAVSGPRTAITGSGEIQTIAIELMKKVAFPDKYGVGETLYDMWYNSTSGYVGPLGSGSDYAAFYHNGISSLDISGGPGKGDPVYQYHSLYDTYDWMANYADPGFQVHKAMGQWVTLLMYHLADDPLIPFDLPNAATTLRALFQDLQDDMAELFPTVTDLELGPLSDAIAAFESAAERIDALATQALSHNDTVLLGVINSKYRDFNRGYASQGALPGRLTYNNVVSAPGLDNGYGASVFPAVGDSLDQGDRELADEWIVKSANAVLRAAEILTV
ncbi:hypothetical protein MCOR02_002178 [Pyricularia oryzae]|nr:hypothetical protein MCOR01_010457 [Pyricularia oryzae]KAH9438560.1 hypothetical protein MCOR02_002178 [Pyricularia oryzae]KAI6282413.1 hypothetical protein MCOR26_002802 [Pyricularia oryzae]KAI6298727.1 hypothetical protein MCOR29_011074 [Pyricularia oryzae]KAI6337484.1 hypothetical protein MCOR28_008521 [Pyricularia oryzae]